jgi:uncharacterized protein (DUF952 family)
MILYHVVTPDYWASLASEAAYISPTFVEEGFIHLSTESQVAGVIERYYQGFDHLIWLHITAEALGEALVFEPATNSELFPHLYAPLNKSAIAQVTHWHRPLA